MALALQVARPRHPLARLLGPFGRSGQSEIGGGHGRHLHLQIDAVHQGAGDAALVLELAARRLAACPSSRTAMAAAAGVHGGHQLDAGRIAHGGVGPRHHHFADF